MDGGLCYEIAMLVSRSGGEARPREPVSSDAKAARAGGLRGALAGKLPPGRSKKWRQRPGDPADPASRIELALLGGHSAESRLRSALETRSPVPAFVGRSAGGAAFAGLPWGAAEMAAGNAPFSASLSGRWSGCRLRRERVSRRQVAVLVLLSFRGVLLLVVRWSAALPAGLSAADARWRRPGDAEAALRASEREREACWGDQADPGCEMGVVPALKTFGRIQVRRPRGVRVQPAALRRTARATSAKLSASGRPELAPRRTERLPEPEAARPPFVIGLILEGDRPAVAPTGRDRRASQRNGYFRPNVDRLVRERGRAGSAEVDPNGTETYALLLTPEDDHWPAAERGPQ